MKKVEAALTTKLLKVIDGEFDDTIWVEVKVVERPRRFSTKVLSHKAKMMLQFTKMKHKFSDAARMGTPLDFIFIPKAETLLCIIFYKARQKSTAYFLKYNGGDYLLTEDECKERCVKLLEL